MNKNILVVIFSIIVLNVMSQDTTGLNNVIRLVDKNKIVEAKQEIDSFEKNTKNLSNPVFWFYKGFVYQSIFESDNEAVKKLSENSLQVAYNSYVKALETDKNKAFIDKIMTAFGYLTNEFMQNGIEEFNNKNYKTALSNFENSIKINSLPEIMFVDTVLYYNSALAAEKMGDYSKAIMYYSKAIDLKFGEGKIYIDLAVVYKKNDNKIEYINTLNEGLKFFPNDIDILNEFINYYISIADADNVIKYTEQAIKQDTTNSNLYFILGSMYETKNRQDDAIIQYKKAIEIDSINADATFNLGVIYYNRGVDKIKHATTKEQKKQAEYDYNRALIYIEKVYKIEPNSKDIVFMLKNIYSIIGDEQKKQEMEKKILELDKNN